MEVQTGYSVKKLLEAIRRKCRDCSGGAKEEVENCPIRDCPLYSFRLAVNMEQTNLPFTRAGK